MAHHYAYITRVAVVRESESYAEAAKDPNRQKAMEAYVAEPKDTASAQALLALLYRGTARAAARIGG